MKLLLYSLAAIGFSYCAQNKSAQNSSTEIDALLANSPQTIAAIKNAYAYSQVKIAGTIAIDENGNQTTKGVDTIYTIYLETSGNAAPEIQTIWINNTAHSLSVSPLTEKSVQIGLPAAGKTVSINAGDGNKLWQIDVGEAVPVNNKTLPVTTGNDRAINQVIIEGVLNNKKFSQPIVVIQLPRMEGL